MSISDIPNRFNYHPPSSDDIRELHEAVRDELRSVAEWFNKELPDGREKSMAVTKLEESMFWANAAIARNQ